MMKVKRLFVMLCTACALVLTGGIMAGCDGDIPQVPDVTTYTVEYARGAEDATGDIPAVAEYLAGSKVTLLPADTFAREGYDFDGWRYGETTYAVAAEFTMPASNVVFTAVWKQKTTTSDPSAPPEIDPNDVPTTTELAADFYDATKWTYMTNTEGAVVTNDGGDTVYALNDGSVKFHKANQAIEIGDLTNRTVSFMLKATNDFSIWFNSSTKDNKDNYSYRLAYAYSGLRLVLSSSGDKAAANISDTEYTKGEWNRFDVVFATADGVTEIKVYINNKRAKLTAGESMPKVEVKDNTLKHTRPASFVTGNYMCVKTWFAHNYLQLKPVAKASEQDMPIIACIGASITEGAGAGDGAEFYTRAYPAQLQNTFAGAYNVINFGNSGKTVSLEPKDDKNNSLAWLKQDQWTGVQAIKPDIAILNIGTNDSKTANNPEHDAFKASYEHLLSELKKVNPNMKIYICTVPYAYSDIWGISNTNIGNIIAPVQREIANAQGSGYTLIDLYEFTQNKEMLFGDGVHPTARGYEMIVQIIKKAIELNGTGGGIVEANSEFMTGINAEYDDKISDITATITEETVEGQDGKIKLTVSGKTTLAANSYLKLKLTTGNADQQELFKNVTILEGSPKNTFTITQEVQILTGTDWYNIRLYVSEDEYYALKSKNCTYNADKTFTTKTRKATVKYWGYNGGGYKFLCLQIGDNVNVELTSSVIAVVNDKLTLTVIGTSDTSGIKLGVYKSNPGDTDTTKYNQSVDITVGANGAFTAAFDLSAMPKGGWYNARIYYPDGKNYKAIPLALTKYNDVVVTSDQYFKCAIDKVVFIKTWEDGGVNILSFDVKEYFVTVESATVTETNGKIMLAVSGKSSSDVLLGINDGNGGHSHQVKSTINANGEYSVEFDLATLETKETSGAEWFNVGIANIKSETGGSYEFYGDPHGIGLNEVTVHKGDVFYSANRKIIIESWSSGNWKSFSLDVHDYDSTTTVTATSVEFKDGNFVVKGTTKNVTALWVYLINTTVEASKTNRVSATLGGNLESGTFEAQLPLSTLIGYNKSNTPFNLRYDINALSANDTHTNIPTTGLDMNIFNADETGLFWLKENSKCTAVYYNDTYVLTKAEITEQGGKATLKIEGKVKAAETAANTIWLVLDETANGTGKQKIVAANTANQAGTFAFSVDISGIEGSSEAVITNGASSRHYYLRLYTGTGLTKDNYTTGTSLADINSRWAASSLFNTITVSGGNSVYYFIRNSLTAYDTLGIVRVEQSGPVAKKIKDINNVTLGYWANKTETYDLTEYVNANGVTVTYEPAVGDSTKATAAVDGNTLTVTAAALTGSTTVTVAVKSDGTTTFSLSFTVTLVDSVITQTKTYNSFLTASSWEQLQNDVGNQPTTEDGKMKLDCVNVYQNIGTTTHISFDLKIVDTKKYGFEIWFRSTTNDNNGSGKGYVMHGYLDGKTTGKEITISRDGTTLGAFPKISANEFHRIDITMLDVKNASGAVEKTIINIYLDGQKVTLVGDKVQNGSIVDDTPNNPSGNGVYFVVKTWDPVLYIGAPTAFSAPTAVREEEIA